jgi:hypothetical protein
MVISLLWNIFLTIPYAVINQTYIPAGNPPPPPIHFFLWLLSKNKLLTKDNLEKRQHIDDTTCLFCSERESVHHLFFDCVVAKRAWEMISQVTGVKTG